MLEINLNMYHAVALAAVLFWLGSFLCGKIGALGRYCIPAPLVGGVCFAAVNTALYATGTAFITFDDTLQTVFMNIFFTTVGFTVSLQQLKKGGKAVFLCLMLAVAITVIQNVLGVFLVGALGPDSRLGLCAGSIALVGGPGTAAAYGQVMEGMGIQGASVAGLACATFGLVAGSIMGGPTAARRIKKHGLVCPAKAEAEDEDESGSTAFTTSSARFVEGFMLLMLALGIGSFVGSVLTRVTGITFPSYIGAMITAAVVRNVIDVVERDFPEEEVEVVGSMSLSLFLAMALAGLQLWLLVDLAIPLVTALAAQVVMMFLFAYFVVFNVMGRDYDAAVMTAGFVGFAMGATSNAMANMQAVTRRHGPSHVAYFAIPMVGSLFIDFINALIITGILDFLSK
ncbi:sodium/glutamate symporter [Cloacibacillus sp. An23]|uniref:sodium/glutamate symporter n=1 Tax=Cloacibacillus sp. An23 TaxID=1965591 RepID=UPI000B370348|nr:sodium/glutamate symporter [Cloacibacillus sp. An23]OUO93222.1 sodium/glutamate symporter [Cloacibacillus sp. An23]